MQLHYSDLSPFARKVRIVLLEKGLDSRVEKVEVSPYEPGGQLLLANPLSKVPTLVLDDGTALYDSAVICDYLDSLTGTPLGIPNVGMPHFVARRRLALLDGILEASFNISCERNRRPESERSANWISHWGEAVARGVDALEAEHHSFGDKLSLVHISTVCALDYIAFRAPDLLDWRSQNPRLSEWYEVIGEREAMQVTRPGI